MLFAEWKDEETLEYRYEEGLNEGREEIPGLLEQEYTLAEIKAKSLAAARAFSGIFSLFSW
ncbi:MAG: hypothetical protein LBQ57_02620 [Spirochaetales bacterium]|jgi:hypothetical protein|nr:hypothetical protein [Spirochaetales bacterium]